uniref:helix-turn-helix domain-containing protein n=1 Tax=Denitromonas sp. TaxID=2734609 RepID=UPI002C170F07|nr:helix-turn-helix domain-containing protein [Denitromonas sp.]
VVTATNRDLEADMQAGRFREDLFYRLAAITVHVPPLRERTMDIPLIANAFAAELRSVDGDAFAPLDKEVLACLAAYRWPGNVRELRNEVLRMAALSDDARLRASDLSPRVLRAAEADDEVELNLLAGMDGDLKTRLETLEARIVKESLIRHRWNKTRAAKELGLSRVGLRNKLSRYGLEKN